MLPTETTFIRGSALRYARVGTGPPVVLLHGYPDNLQIFSAIARYLTVSRTVIAFDWPGMGESKGWSGGATPFVMADHLREILDHLSIPSAVICGHDMGGQPAVVFAAQHPERVEKFVVMNSLLMHDTATSWEIQLLRRFRINRLLLRHAPRLVFERALRTSMRATSSLQRDVRADFWRSFRRPDVREFIIRMCAGYEGTLHHLPAMYANLQVPTVALWGEHDKHFPVAQGRRFSELARAPLAIIDNAPHWMVLEDAERVAAEILAFVGQP